MTRRATRWIAVFVLVLTGCGRVGSDAMGPLRVVGHDIDAVVNPERGHLGVRDELALAGRGDDLVFTVDAALSVVAVRAADDEDDLDIEEFTVGRRRHVQVVLPALVPSRLTVVLEGTLDAGGGGGGDRKDGMDGIPDRPRVDADEVWLPGGSGWYPEPAGEVLARFVLRVVTPAALRVVAAGERLEDRVEGRVRITRTATVRPTDELTVVAAPFTVRQRDVDGVPVQTWLRSDDQPLSDRYLEASARHLRDGVERFGPYPHPAFQVVETTFPAGLGYAGFTLLGASVIRLPFIPDTSLRHELFHCWWGNGVLGPARGDPGGDGSWVEGLTTWLADHDGPGWRKEALREQRVGSHPHRTVTPLRSLAVPTSERATGYSKAAMVFHMLSLEVGGDALARALRAVARDRLGRRTSWADLTAAVSREAARPLDWFAAQWLDRTASPALALTGAARATDRGAEPGGVAIEVSQQQAGEPLRLRIPVDVTLADGRTVTRQVVVDGSPWRGVVTHPGASAAVSVRLDPRHDVFRTLSNGELEASLARVEADPTRIAVVLVPSSAPPALALAFRRIGQGLLRRGWSVLTDPEMLPAGTEHAHALFVVATRDVVREWGLSVGSVAVPFPEGVGSAPGGAVRVGDASETGGALLLAMAHPGAIHRTVAFLLADDADELTAAVKKLTYYARYGWARFDGGKNVGKGWLPPPGPDPTFREVLPVAP